MFKNMKPFFRYVVPRIPMIAEERAVWESFSTSNVSEFVQNLTKLRAADMDLCYKSLEVF
jgi:hypothetical protein